MKRQIWISCTAALLALSLLAGCGKNPDGQNAEATPTPAPVSTPAPTEPAPTPTPVPVIGDYPELSAALDACVGYGQGEAGVSLKTAAAAAGLLEWSESYAADIDEDTLAVLVADWISGLDETNYEKFWDNWADLDTFCRRLIEDPASQKDLLESAGVTLSKTAYSLTNYTKLYNAVNRSTGK